MDYLFDFENIMEEIISFRLMSSIEASARLLDNNARMDLTLTHAQTTIVLIYGS